MRELTVPHGNRTLATMRTTIELPDEVFQQAQQQASQRGLDVNQFISTAVTKMVQASLPPASASSGRRVEFPTFYRGQSRRFACFVFEAASRRH
jgi:hypothetical protein